MKDLILDAFYWVLDLMAYAIDELDAFLQRHEWLYVPLFVILVSIGSIYS